MRGASPLPRLTTYPCAAAPEQEVLGGLLEEQARNPKIAVLEALHAAAFGSSSPLGHSTFPSAESLGAISSKTLRSFIKSRLNADDIVVAAVSESPPCAMRGAATTASLPCAPLAPPEDVEHGALISSLTKHGGLAALPEVTPVRGLLLLLRLQPIALPILPRPLAAEGTGG